MAQNVLEIDGSILEGGGQILRMAVSLSAIMRIPIHITKIRAGRAKPGLAAQHMKGLELARDMCGGRLVGADLGSQEVSFTPGILQSGSYFADTQTAGIPPPPQEVLPEIKLGKRKRGKKIKKFASLDDVDYRSVSLLSQVAIPCGMFAKDRCQIILKGGTNAKMAPQTDYTLQITRKIFQNFGAEFKIYTNVRGFFPRGGGHVDLRTFPVSAPGLQGIQMTDFGTVVQVKGYSFVAGVLPLKVAQTMALRAEEKLRKKLPQLQIHIEAYKEQPDCAVGAGGAIILWARTSTGCVLGGSGLGEKSKEPDRIGESAAEELLKSIESKACFDDYSQDQVIILMALAKGKSIIRVGSEVTQHTRTAIHIAELMTSAKFNIMTDTSTGSITHLIECQGIGCSK